MNKKICKYTELEGNCGVFFQDTAEALFNIASNTLSSRNIPEFNPKGVEMFSFYNKNV